MLEGAGLGKVKGWNQMSACKNVQYVMSPQQLSGTVRCRSTSGGQEYPAWRPPRQNGAAWMGAVAMACDVTGCR